MFRICTSSLRLF